MNTIDRLQPAADSFGAHQFSTPHLLLGPYYPVAVPEDASATLWCGDGEFAVPRMRLFGAVRRLNGRPVEQAQVEIWHADWLGQYRHPSAPDHEHVHAGFAGYGRTVTDARGGYRFSTVVPGGYHQGDAQRAPHVHVQVTSQQDRLVTQVFIPINGALPRDRWLDAVRRPDALIAKVIRQTNDAVELEWNVVMAIL